MNKICPANIHFSNPNGSGVGGSICNCEITYNNIGKNINLICKTYLDKDMRKQIEVGMGDMEDKITIRDMNNELKEFVFKDSNRETLKKVGETLIKYSELR